MRPSDSQRKAAIVVAAGLSLSGGVIGTLFGRIFASALETSPPWLGPAILAGSIALLIAGLLLLPTAIRMLRAPGSHH